MRDDLRVFLFPGDYGGCGFYRMQEPARVLQNHGLDISITTDIPVTGLINERDGSFRVQKIEFEADVMVLQRPMLRAMVHLIEACQKRGIACIVELDDDLAAVHRNNVAFGALDPTQNKTSNWTFLKECCEIADLVTVSTPNLAKRYAPHGKFRVLRNCVPQIEFGRKKTPGDSIRLGWTGTLQTHPEDLLEAGVQINAVLNSTDGDPGFWVVGDGIGVERALGLTAKNPLHATGWVPRDEYMKTMNQHIDVGIVPLTIDTFNNSKSYLKGLEFASQGIPTVLSATEENVLLGEITGNPVVRKARDWQRHLRPLLSDRDYWMERSHEVRESVRHLTYENCASQWLEAWNQAVENRAKDKKSAFGVDILSTLP